MLLLLFVPSHVGGCYVVVTDAAVTTLAVYDEGDEG